jgi:hypothetical protein
MRDALYCTLDALLVTFHLIVREADASSICGDRIDEDRLPNANFSLEFHIYLLIASCILSRLVLHPSYNTKLTLYYLCQHENKTSCN